MRKLLVLLAVAVLAVSCFQTSDPDPKEKGTPLPTATDTVSAPADVEGWADGCMVDTDCAEMAVGPCQEAACEQGECVAVDKLPGANCETDAALGDCEKSWCQGGEAGMECVVAPAADGTPCGDFFAMCNGVGACLAGSCVDPCDDGNLCTDGKCTETGCVFTDNTAPCDDEDVCTENDTCTGGACVGTPIDDCECSEDIHCDHLNDGDPCTGYAYCTADNNCEIKGEVKCKATGQEPCFVNVCNPDDGECVEDAAEDGIDCTDGNDCTDADFCVAGECTGYAEVTCEWDCGDDVDEDDDGYTDCDDKECWGVGECPTPECGDSECTELADEDCVTCEADCGPCPPECGDGNLDADDGEQCDDGAKEPGDGCDENCKVEPVAAAEGAIIITEVMADPAVLEDSAAEWVELYNTTEAEIDINAWQLKDEGQDEITIFTLGGTIVPAKGYIVLAPTGLDTNGGITAGFVYDYANFKLSNTDDEIIITTGLTEVDKLVYDNSFPGDTGISMSLSLSKLTGAENDLALNWCDGAGDYDTDNAGTPGAANLECPFCGDDVCNGEEDCDTCADCACEATQDCVTGTCVDKKTNGTDCGDNLECASGFCIDMVCCDVLCDGLCEACDVVDNVGTCSPTAADQDGADDCGTCQVCDGMGACKNVDAGLDPLDDCTASAEATCGFDGTCDGSGACANWNDQTVAEAAKCTDDDSVFHDIDFCDGLGDFTDAGDVSCEPYKCDVAAPACFATCQTDAECFAGYTCDGNNECTQ